MPQLKNTHQDPHVYVRSTHFDICRLSCWVSFVLLPGHRQEKYNRTHSSQISSASQGLRWTGANNYIQAHWSDLQGTGIIDSIAKHSAGYERADQSSKLENSNIVD